MNKAKTCKLWAKLAAVVLSLTLMLALLGVSAAFPVKANESNYFEDFEATPIGLENNQFDIHSGSIPESPNGWSAQAFGDENSQGAAVGGVLPLGGQITADNMRDAKLDIYPEYANTLPETPFGNTAIYPGTNYKLLLVNTAASETVYGYKSNSLTLGPNKFYKFSVYVKTGDFKDGRGASVRLAGLDENVAFTAIDTNDIVTAPELKGFKQYTFYIATSPFKSYTVELQLSVGSSYTDEKKPENNVNAPAAGYAFFDNVIADEISPYTFYTEAGASSETIVKDYSRPMDSGNWSFGTGLTDWSFAGNEVQMGRHGVFMGGFTDNNDYNLEKDPLSPNGKNDNSGILVLSSYKNAQLTDVSIGYESVAFTVERFKFYRVSAFVKTIDVTGGSGAAMVLTSDRNTPDDEDDDFKTQATSLTGDDANKARYGWKEQAIYVKGSVFVDYAMKLQLRLGTDDAQSSGIAMFDEVKVLEITPAEFTEFSAGGTIASLDGEFPADSVTNGSFYTFDTYEELKFPLAPASWKKLDASKTETTGASSGSVKTDDLISGVIPTDRAHFNANVGDYGYGASSAHLPEYGNVLYIASKSPTAAGYRSANITVATGKAGKITVLLKADNMTGYGANLVLKSGNDVIATLEGIKNTNGFVEYTFAVEAGAKDRSALSVEIWLGMFDRTNNASKLASGNVYVQKVSYAEIADTDAVKFAGYKAEYETAKSLNLNPRTAAFSFANSDLNSYDYYDGKFVKHPYLWTLSANGTAPLSNVAYGIFDSSNMTAGQGEVPPYFKNDEENAGKYVLMLHNAKPTSSRLTLTNGYTLNASTYYQISVTMKLDLNPGANSKGVTLALSGTDYKFENVLTTSEFLGSDENREVFRTFTFYAAMGAEAKDVSIAISLGGDKLTNEYCEGRVYVNNVTVNEIQQALYEEQTKNIDDDTKYSIKADFTAPVKNEDDGGTKGSIDWWVIPSILFAVAILIALVGFSVRKVMEKRAAKPSKAGFEKVSSYDRNATLAKMEKDADGNLVRPTGDDAAYNEFDDDRATVQPSEKRKAAPAPSAEETTATEPTEQTTTDAENATDAAEMPQGAEDKPTAVKVAAPAKTAEPKPAPDAYTDEFED